MRGYIVSLFGGGGGGGGGGGIGRWLRASTLAWGSARARTSWSKVLFFGPISPRSFILTREVVKQSPVTAWGVNARGGGARPAQTSGACGPAHQTRAGCALCATVPPSKRSKGRHSPSSRPELRRHPPRRAVAQNSRARRPAAPPQACPRGRCRRWTTLTAACRTSCPSSSPPPRAVPPRPCADCPVHPPPALPSRRPPAPRPSADSHRAAIAPLRPRCPSPRRASVAAAPPPFAAAAGRP